MSKKTIEKLIEGTIFVLIIIGFIFVGTRDFSQKIEVDSEKFDHDYKNVDKDNVFVYVNATEVLAKLKNGSAIIFMGFPKNKWSGYYANILNETAKENNIKEILYYDFYEDRQNKNATYQSIVLKLSNYLVSLDDDTQNIYAPTLIIVKNGNIISIDSETSLMTGNINPKDYWDEYKKGTKKNIFSAMFGEYLKDENIS